MRSMLTHNELVSNGTQNVHEGPIGIGTRVQYSEVSLSPGNVISDGMSPTRSSRSHPSN